MSATTGTYESHCSACAELLQELQDAQYMLACWERACERWIEDCRRARSAAVEMMAHGAMADDPEMLKRWDNVQCINIPKPNAPNQARSEAE